MNVLPAGMAGLNNLISDAFDNVNTLLFKVVRFTRRRFSFLRRMLYRSISV